MTEERCGALVGRLCSRLGWSVRPAPAVRYVLFDRDGRWITFGQSAEEIVATLCDPAWAKIAAEGGLPAGLQGCSSPEELALKIEASLP
jgi:hypothetical protein